MVNCPVCNERITHLNLRMQDPKCSKGHRVGSWVKCGNQGGGHIYLSQIDGPPCPVCGDESTAEVKEQTPVKCLHVSENTGPCASPFYKWMVDGPPCYMNHLDRIIEVVEKKE